MMDTIIPLLFLCLSVFSTVIYFKSPEKFIMRCAKGLSVFLFSIAAFGAYLSGDYAIAYPIVVIVLFLTLRQIRITKKPALLSVVTIPDAPLNTPETRYSKHQIKDWFKNISFEYTDSNGNSTHRKVDVKEINEQNITGYCHSRRQLRTFRLDRIENSEIVIRDTGELINVYDWIVQLYEE